MTNVNNSVNAIHSENEFKNIFHIFKVSLVGKNGENHPKSKNNSFILKVKHFSVSDYLCRMLGLED